MIPYKIDGIKAGAGALDFSYLLHKPAGCKGFIKIRDSKFFTEDGSRIKFFGADIPGGAVAPEHDAAEIISERMAKSGLNMARLHFGDANHKNKGATLIDYTCGNSQNIDEEAFERLDYFVWQLKKRGIYIHLDLFVGRTFLPGDELDFQDDLQQKFPLKQIIFYNKRLIALQKKYAYDYLNHYNPYTKLCYKDEPAVAVVQLCNENSIFWESGQLTAPSYFKELDGMWNDWLLEKYKNTDNLSAAWTNSEEVKGLTEGESLEAKNIKRPPISQWDERKIHYTHPYNDVEGQGRFGDHVEFLIQKECEYVSELKEYLISIGVKCPINSSNHAKGPAELYAYSVADVAENNAYFNHPIGQRANLFHEKEIHSTDPRKINVPNFEQNLITNMIKAKVSGMPFIITEWNTCFPTKFSADAMIFMTAYAMLQDWDGIMFHAYTHSRTVEGLSKEFMSGWFESYNDPSIFGMAGVCAYIFYNGLIKEAKNLVDICYSETDAKSLCPGWNTSLGAIPFISKVDNVLLKGNPYSGSADIAISSGITASSDLRGAKRFIVYTRSPYGDQYQKELKEDEFLSLHQTEDEENIKIKTTDEMKNIRMKLGSRGARLKEAELFDEDYRLFSRVYDYIAKSWGIIGNDKGLVNDGCIVSDTGEISYDYQNGIIKVETEKIASAAGKLGKNLTFGKINVKLKNDKAAVTVLPLDGMAIGKSLHYIITAHGECINTGMVWDKNELVDKGHEPVLIDQVCGQVTIPLDVNKKDVKVSAWHLDCTGKRAVENKVDMREGSFTVNLDENDASMYYEVMIS